MSTTDEINAMLGDVEARESKLSDRERGFIDSISVQLAAGKTLTPKQDQWLETIWNRVTS